MPESHPPIELRTTALAELHKQIGERRLPPVGHWHPEHCGHSRMRIARDGTWYHDGTPIHRLEMVRLFSRILRREPDGRHVLVTPTEKLDIDVDCTAFRAVDMKRDGEGPEQRVAFQLDSGDAVIAGPDQPLYIVAIDGHPSPRLLVRHGLEAELARPVYYALAELAVPGRDGRAGVWSDGAFFPLEPSS